MRKMMQCVMVATIMFVYALGIEAQGVLTTDAMIRVAEQKTKVERMADRKSTRLNSSHTDSSRMPSSA